MAMRASSLANNELAITRELNGKYGVVLEVKNNLGVITEVAELISSNIANIDTIAINIDEITTVYDNISDVVTVADSIASVNTSSTNILAINTVSDNIDNVITVSLNLLDINTVALNISDLSTVSDSISNVNTVGLNITDVDTVSDDISSVVTVSNNIDDINTVSQNIGAVSNISDNMDDVTYFADIYQGSKIADPVLRNDGSDLISGDLYFYEDINNSDNSVMKVFDGIVWHGAYSGIYNYYTKTEADAVVLDLIEDMEPKEDKTYSSLKTQELHNAQATAIASMAGASCSFKSITPQTIPFTTPVQLTWTTVLTSTNPSIFELNTNSIIMKKNGIYNFFSSLTFYRTGGEQTTDVTFQIYRIATGVLLGSYVYNIDMKKDTKITVPMSSLLVLDDIVGEVHIGVRMFRTGGDQTVSLFDFNSTLSLTAVTSSATVDTMNDALGALITGVLI